VAETIAALTCNVYELTWQACCYELATAVADCCQLNGKSAHWCVGMVSKQHRTDGQGVTCKWPPKGEPLVMINK